MDDRSKHLEAGKGDEATVKRWQTERAAAGQQAKRGEGTRSPSVEGTKILSKPRPIIGPSNRRK